MNKEIIVESNPKSVISEAIRMIRTNIEFSAKGKHAKTVLVTSSLSGEGKSFISTNLAAAFSQMNKKVIIIDADLRRGRLHKIFNLENKKGLSTILKNNEVSNIDDYIINTGIKSLDVLVRGEIPINPSELLTYKCIDILIETLKEKYDYIIFDGVPTTGLSDSLIMAKKVDMTLIVSALNIATKELLKNTKKSLESVNANIIGVVVNKVPRQGNGYYKYE